MKIILVSNFYDIPNEHILLNLLFCEGLRYFHLRKKNYTKAQMENYINQIPAIFHQNIVLHSHFDLVHKYNLMGAHFTQNLTYESYCEFCYNKDPLDLSIFKHKSLSLHSIKEIKNTPNHEYQYVFLSPVFDSISNSGYNSKFRINELKLLLSNNKEDRPAVIALSGINEGRLSKIHDIGFDGFALLGYIWSHFEDNQNIIDSVLRYRNIKIEVNRLTGLP
jgi:thiamine-phosphate pyrophosphorylase